jgi:uncharacterized protein DUF6916
MNISRRSFLQTGSKLGLAALVTGRISAVAFGQATSSQALGTGLGTPIPKEALADPLHRITRAMFADNLKTKFRFGLGEVKLTDMTLVEVQDQTSSLFKSEGTRAQDCFALVFTGPRSLPLRQGTYLVEHGKLGTFNLFIVPGDASGRSGIRYGALINRLNP